MPHSQPAAIIRLMAAIRQSEERIMNTPIDSKALRTVLGSYPTGVCAISARVKGAPLAMVVGTFTSVSLDPPLVGFLPARSSETWALLRGVERFCVNVLAADQAEMCQRMATR